MRNVVLVVVIVLWAVIEINGEYSFGDIISFKRNCPCISSLTYKHFAIYVGDKKIDGKDSDTLDIYQRTGPVKPEEGIGLSNCIFSKLEDERKTKIGSTNIEEKSNYFDGFDSITVGSEEQIIKRIKETKGNCNKYNPFFNNCEHLATFVRYGVRVSLQSGTFAERFCKNKDVCEEVNKIIEQIKNEKKCNKCTASSTKYEG